MSLKPYKFLFREWRKRPAQWWHHKALSPRDQRVVLMAGFQRSGTNMLMKVLDQHRLTTVYHEADPRVFDDYSLRDNARLTRHVASAKGSLVVIKTLLDIHRYRELNELAITTTGAAPIILWPLRNLNDCVNSHVVRWPELREEVDEILADGVTRTWRGGALSAEALALLRDLYTPECSIADCKALAWMMRNLILLNDDFPREQLLYVDYDEFVQNPQPYAKAMADSLGLPEQVGIADHVNRKSVGRAPAPVIDEKIREACGELLSKITAIEEARWVRV